MLALDVPSGIQSDTGRVLGRAVRATHTITFIGLKPGLLTLDGPDHAGEITVESLGLSLPAATAWVASPELFREALKRRPRNFHKGQAGSLGILGGASGMTGAALLAGRAALKLGAGRVYLGLLNETPMGVDPVNPELMLRHVDDALGLDLDALVVGPGLGEGERGETVVGAALASDIPCVLDADALNLISGNPDFRKACAPSTSRARPMPKRPSTTRPQFLSGISSGAVATVTRKNCSCSRAATTRASPPLLPGPASTRTSLLRSDASRAASAAAAAPARSMRGGLASAAACSIRRYSSVR